MKLKLLYYHKKYSRSRLIKCALFTKCVLLNAQIYKLGCQEVWHIDNGITFPRQSFTWLFTGSTLATLRAYFACCSTTVFTCETKHLLFIWHPGKSLLVCS